MTSSNSNPHQRRPNVAETAAAVESERVTRAEAVETDRSDLADAVETVRSDRADAVETDRSDRADAVEVDREERAVIVESFRVDAAALLEADRQQHNLWTEKQWRERSRIVNRRFWYLFGGLVIIFGLLAYRSERNAADIASNNAALATGLHNACLARQGTAIQYNQGREALIQITVKAPHDPPLTAEETATLTQQLRDGMLLPIEDCGPNP